MRAPFSLQELVYLDGQKAVVHRSRMTDPLELGQEGRRRYVRLTPAEGEA